MIALGIGAFLVPVFGTQGQIRGAACHVVSCHILLCNFFAPLVVFVLWRKRKKRKKAEFVVSSSHQDGAANTSQSGTKN